MTAQARPRLLIVDGHSMAFRAYFALPVDSFVTSSGQHTNAVHGFISMLINLVRDEAPTHVAVAFDAGSHTFRTEEYAEYKAGRAATPEEFKGQVPLIQQALDVMGVQHYQLDGWEADDILATWAHQGTEAGMDVLVCSGDRDALQLINPTTLVLYPMKGVSTLARMDSPAVVEKYGVTPEQYSDLAALVGESADNLPGVPKVGPKTAAKWISTYGGLSEILEQADQIKGVVGENLRAHADQVRLNRKLNQLRSDVEVPVAAPDLVLADFDRAKLHELFDVLEFRTLRDRFFKTWPQAEGGDDAAAVEAVAVEVRATGFEAWLKSHPAEHAYGVDLLGTVVSAQGDLTQIAVSAGDGSAYVADPAEIEPADETALVAFLESDAPKVVHDVKHAQHLLAGFGAKLQAVRTDTAIAAYLIHPDSRSYNLEDLAQRYLGLALFEGISDGALDLEGDGQVRSGAERAHALPALAAHLRTELEDRGNAQLLDTLELPIAELLFEMEQLGIAVDTEFLADLTAHFDGLVTEAANEAYAAIGHEVNLSSPKQLQQVLFEELDLPKTRKTKTGYTTDADALTDLYSRQPHPFLENLLAHRDAIKLRQTVDGLIKTIAADGRIHTRYSQTIAATGRLSSADPNLQNIPIRTPQGQRIREAFIAGDEFDTLMTADYSQIEMRIMAHLSADQGLIEAFQAGEDLHSFVGSRVFGVPPSEVDAAMRSKVKAMSYGLAYGLSAFGLSKQLRVSTAEAQGLMNDYFDRFGKVKEYLAGVVDQARALGYTETILGRRRYLPDLTSDQRQRREMAERMALNAPIQGSAADIIKVAMLGVAGALASNGLKSRMLLQVHDELVFEVAPGEHEQLEALVRQEMGQAADLAVPLDVSVGWGKTWRHAGH